MQEIESITQARFFIAEPSLIKEMEETFSALSMEEDTLSKTYLNKVTGERWLSYTLDSSSHSGGTHVFGKLPLPGTDKLIDLAVTSQFEDEVFAASRTLVENEETKEIDFRLGLISRLEQMNNKSRQISIIEYTDLDSPLNRREIIGKSYDEVSADSKYFRDISDRAKKLMD
jgi:hypothetical protein